MMSRTFGAPLGGTTLGGQYGLDWSASRLITPPTGRGGNGRYLPSMVVVALGDPGSPVICWASAVPALRENSTQARRTHAPATLLPSTRVQPKRVAVNTDLIVCFL